MHHITPNVTRQNGKTKAGQGFSIKELKEAGISKQDAQKMQIRIDVRRRSCHQENVDNIKAHKAKPKA
jgi:large subunit ribosomal protein L13e